MDYIEVNEVKLKIDSGAGGLVLHGQEGYVVSDLAAKIAAIDDMRGSGQEIEVLEEFGGSFGLLDIENTLAKNADILYTRCLNLRNKIAEAEGNTEVVYGDIDYVCPPMKVDVRRFQLEFNTPGMFTYHRVDRHAPKGNGFQIVRTTILGEDQEIVIKKDGNVSYPDDEEFQIYLAEVAVHLEAYAKAMHKTKGLDDEVITPARPTPPTKTERMKGLLEFPVKRVWISSWEDESGIRQKSAKGVTKEEAEHDASFHHKSAKGPHGAYSKLSMKPGLFNWLKVTIMSAPPSWILWELSQIVSPWW